MDSDHESAIKRIKLMTPYVQLNKAFLINSMPGIVKQFNNEQTADVRVILGTTELETDNDDNADVLHLHKIILSSSSPMFAAWLNKYSDVNALAVLRIPESYDWMSDFFRFFYTGQLMMTSENIIDIYMIADKYLVETLKIHCEDNIRENLKIKLEKSTCSHIRPSNTPSSNNSSSRYDDEESPDPTLALFHPYQSFLRSRCAISTANNVNIFSNINNYTQQTSKSNNIATRSNISSNIFNNTTSSTSNNTNINNSNLSFPLNSKNPFSRSMFDIFSNNSNPDMENFQNSLKSDSVCDRCSQGLVSVCRVFTFHTVVRLAQITNNNELRKLAIYNLIIRLTEELRSENYCNFIQLPFSLLVDILEDDNFYCPEFQIFCGVKHWIESAMGNKNQTSSESATSTATDASKCDLETSINAQSDQLFSLIRLPLLTVDELYDVESAARNSPCFTQSVLNSQIHKAMRYLVYRNVQKAKLELGHIGLAGRSFCRPRIPNDIFNLSL